MAERGGCFAGIQVPGLAGAVLVRSKDGTQESTAHVAGERTSFSLRPTS